MPSSERGLNTVGTAGTVLATVSPTAAIWNIGNRFFDTVDASYLYIHITTLIRTSIYAHIYTLIRTSIYAHIYTLIRTCDTYPLIQSHVRMSVYICAYIGIVEYFARGNAFRYKTVPKPDDGSVEDTKLSTNKQHSL